MKNILIVILFLIILKPAWSLDLGSDFFLYEEKSTSLRKIIGESSQLKLSEIEKEFDKTFPGWKKSISGLTLYSFVLELKNSPEKAKEYLEKGKLLFDNYYKKFQEGNSYFDNFQFEKAALSFSEAYKLTCGLNFQQNSLYKLSLCFFHLKEYEMMIKVLGYYRSTLENPMLYNETNEGLEDYARILSKLAEFEIIGKNYTRAEVLLEESLEKREKSMNSLYNMACLQNVLGNPSEAYQWIMKLIRFYPNQLENIQKDLDLKNLFMDSEKAKLIKSNFFPFQEEYQPEMILSGSVQNREITPPESGNPEDMKEKIFQIEITYEKKSLGTDGGRKVPLNVVRDFEKELKRIFDKTKQVFIESEDMGVCPSGSIKVFLEQRMGGSAMIVLKLQIKDHGEVLFISQSSFLNHLPWNMVYQNRLYSVWDKSFGKACCEFLQYCGIDTAKYQISDKILEGVIHKTMVFGPSVLNLKDGESINEMFNKCEKGEGEALHVLDSMKNIPFLAQKVQENNISLKPLFRFLNTEIPTYSFDVGVAMEKYILEVSLYKKGESVSSPDFSVESADAIYEKLMKRKVVLSFLKGKDPDNVIISYPHFQSDIEKMFYIQTLYNAVRYYYPGKQIVNCPQKIEFTVISGEKRLVLVYIPEFNFIFGKFVSLEEKEKLVPQIIKYLSDSGVEEKLAERLKDYFVGIEALAPFTLVIKTDNDSYCDKLHKALYEKKIPCRRDQGNLLIQVFVNPMIFEDDSIILGLKNE